MDNKKTARDELVAILERDGVLTVPAVVTAAADPTSALHSHFEWDDTDAAVAWRNHQARALIRRYRIEVQVAPEQTVRVRQFSTTGAGTWQNTEDVLATPATRDVLFQQAIKAIAALRRRYSGLVDFNAALAAERDQRQQAAS